MNHIKKITSRETYIVRHPVLRKNKPIESCCFEGDDLPSTQHYGLFVGDNLTGIISLFSNINPIFVTQNQAQIRGMAVLESHHKKGFGAALLKHCENYCMENQIDLIWFNARATATEFYKKIGYRIIGQEFDIKDIGKHYLMHKELKK